MALHLRHRLDESDAIWYQRQAAGGAPIAPLCQGAGVLRPTRIREHHHEDNNGVFSGRTTRFTPFVTAPLVASSSAAGPDGQARAGDRCACGGGGSMFPAGRGFLWSPGGSRRRHRASCGSRIVGAVEGIERIEGVEGGGNDDGRDGRRRRWTGWMEWTGGDGDGKGYGSRRPVAIKARDSSRGCGPLRGGSSWP